MAVKYYCDKCGREIKENDVYDISIRERRGALSYHPSQYKAFELCEDCADEVLMLIGEEESDK